MNLKSDASTRMVGLVFLIIFAVSQGVRDAFFGNVFQSWNFLVVAVFTFGLSIVIFGLSSILRRPGDLSRIFAQPKPLVLMNVTTAIAWLCYLYGLNHLEPAVVATFHNGIGPLIALVAGYLGFVEKLSRMSVLEALCYAGIAASLVGLAAVVILGYSGMTMSAAGVEPVALLIVATGGTAVTFSYIYTKRFTDGGAGSDAVMTTRFLLAAVVTGLLLVFAEQSKPVPPLNELPWLAIASFGLMVLPSFSVQMGVSRTTALVAHVFRSLGPVSVFIVQQVDGRLQFSGATLACILVFSLCTIGASLVSGYKEVADPRVSAS